MPGDRFTKTVGECIALPLVHKTTVAGRARQIRQHRSILLGEGGLTAKLSHNGSPPPGKGCPVLCGASDQHPRKICSCIQQILGGPVTQLLAQFLPDPACSHLFVGQRRCNGALARRVAQGGRIDRDIKGIGRGGGIGEHRLPILGEILENLVSQRIIEQQIHIG